MYKIKSEFEFLRFKGKTIIQVISEYFIDILISYYDHFKTLNVFVNILK